MFVKIIFVILALVTLLLIVAALQPSDYRVTRSIAIAAPAGPVFGSVSDFHRWEEWSPWAKLDPAMTTEFEGGPGTVGSTYRWSGNAKVGTGKMTLIESQAPELLRFKLDFIKPFPSTSLAAFTFGSDSKGTVVTWTMTGQKVFVAKVFTLFVSMDKMVGSDFEKGLAQLKFSAERTR